MDELNPNKHEVTVMIVGVDDEQGLPPKFSDQFGMAITATNIDTGEVSDEIFNSRGRLLRTDY